VKARSALTRRHEFGVEPTGRSWQLSTGATRSGLRPGLELVEGLGGLGEGAPRMMAAASGWVAASVPALMSRVTATPTRSPSVGGRGWHGCRVNTISPGIIFTPLVRTVGALLMGPEGGFITGSDFLMDGGVTAAYRFGDLAPK
jgi:hypothetical protein